jgi:IclR family transcriptional regulator, pca regulon regulatory protein
VSIKPTDFNGSLAKGLLVLEAFRGDRSRLSITDVAKLTGMDRASARRSLLTLAELGYAAYDGKYFTLTPRVLRLGTGCLAAMALPQRVQPWLDDLSERIGESVSVSILDETEIVYVARAAQRRVMSIGLMPGSRLPAYCTSMGRILLAALPDEEVRSILDASDLAPRTSATLTEPEQILQRIAQARNEGFTVVDQEVEIGLRSIAVPLVDSRGRIVAALNTGVAAVQANPADLAALYLPALREAQDALRRIL